MKWLLRALLEVLPRALQDDQVQMIILRLVERATRHANEDQLAQLRADLRKLEDGIRGELHELEKRVSRLEAVIGDVPWPPPPKPAKPED